MYYKITNGGDDIGGWQADFPWLYDFSWLYELKYVLPSTWTWQLKRLEHNSLLAVEGFFVGRLPLNWMTA